MDFSRRAFVPVLLAVAVFSSCASQNGPEPSPATYGFDVLAAALPTDAQLPAGFEADGRCPGGAYCPQDDGFDFASVSGAGATEPTDEWMADSFWLSIAVHGDTDAAAESLANSTASAESRSGKYSIEMEESDSGLSPGEEGEGSYADYTVGDWSGIESLITTSYSGSWADAPSDPRQRAEITLTNGAVVLRCAVIHRSDAGELLARDECRAAIDEYLERLASIDPETAPAVLTPARLAAALPTIDDFPTGSEVSVRCPGDSPCDDEKQTQDASISVDLALPDGVASDGDDDHGRFVVQGGEWSENFWLRVWLQQDEKAAADSVATTAAEYRELTGTVHTDPVATETGYTYGIRGTGEVVDIGGDGWSGALKIYDAEFVHLDGRVTERVFSIDVRAHSGAALVGVDSFLTVQGRSKQDAIDLVTEQVEGYFARLAAES